MYSESETVTPQHCREQDTGVAVGDLTGAELWAASHENGVFVHLKADHFLLNERYSFLLVPDTENPRAYGKQDCRCVCTLRAKLKCRICRGCQSRGE